MSYYRFHFQNFLCATSYDGPDDELGDDWRINADTVDAFDAIDEVMLATLPDVVNSTQTFVSIDFLCFCSLMISRNLAHELVNHNNTDHLQN